MEALLEFMTYASSCKNKGHKVHLKSIKTNEIPRTYLQSRGADGNKLNPCEWSKRSNTDPEYLLFIFYFLNYVCSPCNWPWLAFPS